MALACGSLFGSTEVELIGSLAFAVVDVDPVVTGSMTPGGKAVFAPIVTSSVGAVVVSLGGIVGSGRQLQPKYPGAQTLQHEGAIPSQLSEQSRHPDEKRLVQEQQWSQKVPQE